MLRSCLVFAAVMLGADSARSEAQFSLPHSPTGPGGEDAVETANGTRCRQSMNNNSAYLDIGIGANATMDSFYGNRSEMGDVLGYARIIIPLGAKPERIDCSRLYELEIQRLKVELEMMKMGMQ